MRVVTSKQMKQIEEQSLRYDLTFQRLMENAGSAAAAFIRRTFHLAGLNCMVFCGGGNNGGDGLVVARKLFENGANVLVVQVGDPPQGIEASSMLVTAQLMELPMTDFSLNRDRVLEVMGQADIVVDAIYGTGFREPLGEIQRAACRSINDAIAAVISLDLPSGVACDTGESDPDAVRADFTVAFDSRKPCHVLPPGQALCGRIEVVDIGIPDEAREGIDSQYGVLTTETVLAHLPPRTPESHKGTYGKLLAVCGSAQYRGAAALAVAGALRCGAGIVTVASVETVCAAVSTRLPEAVLQPLNAAPSGVIDWESSLDSLNGPLKTATAVLFGCGIGSGPHATRLLKTVLRGAACPVIVDADGINALAENINILQEASAPVILTPHPGEMARLCRTDIETVEADRNGAALALAQKHGVIVVLKGHETLVANPGGGLTVNATGNAGLAKGGSGDVLAGMMAGFLAQGVEPVHAAACAVHLHGLAADRTAARKSQYAMLPSELLDDLAEIFVENGR